MFVVYSLRIPYEFAWTHYQGGVEGEKHKQKHPVDPVQAYTRAIQKSVMLQLPVPDINMSCSTKLLPKDHRIADMPKIEVITETLCIEYDVLIHVCRKSFLLLSQAINRVPPTDNYDIISFLPHKLHQPT